MSKCRVHPFVYRALRSNYQIGVSYLQDMLPETALLKLGWVLGNYDYEDLRATMEQNIAGEINLSIKFCLLYTSPSPRDVEESRMPSSA